MLIRTLNTWIFSGFLFLAASTANAAIVASLSGSFDRTKPVHLLVVGYSHGMGLQFVKSAVAQGRRYLELYPDREVVLIRNNEFGTPRDATELEALGLKIIQADATPETSSFIVKVATSFSAIASLEFFSHSTVHSGAGLEGESSRFEVNSSKVPNLRGHFLPQGYIFFHGCNTGFFQAPELAQLLGVTVFGALTSTEISKLQKNGAWVRNRKEVPAELWARENLVSYERAIPCAAGACLRLSPDNHTYKGMWGTYQGGGLPFFKAFCNKGLSELECSKVMATALLGWPSVKALNFRSSEADFAEAAIDFLCPADSQAHDGCVRALNQALKPGASEVYSPFKGNSLSCDRKKCEVNWTCRYDSRGEAIRGSCGVSAPLNKEPKTIVQELKRYILGYRALRE